MLKTRITLCLSVMFFILSLSCPFPLLASDLHKHEKAILQGFRRAIPRDKIKKTDDLYNKWKEVKSGKSQAIILDIRTETEFDSGHIQGSSNVDSGNAYRLLNKIQDSETEIWVFCRTKHRASYFVGLLYKFGYTNVYLVEGGIKEWANKGYPLVNEYLGEFKVTKYQSKLQDTYWYRERWLLLR